MEHIRREAFNIKKKSRQNRSICLGGKERGRDNTA